MKVKLTLHRDGVEPRDIVITADSTATVEDVARQIAEADPAGSVAYSANATLTLAVAPPTGSQLQPLEPDVLIAEAPIGSGFNACVWELGPHGSRSTRSVDGRPLVRLSVVGGPSTGAEVQLPAGHFTIGRDAACDVVLADRMVSKRHARIEVGSHVEVVDLQSSNGVVVDGAQVTRLRVIPGQPFQLGETTIVVDLMASFEADGADPVLERGGSLMFNRSPRVEERYPGTEFDEPRMPREKPSKQFPWPLLFTPIMLAGIMYLLTERARTLIVAAATPLMMFGNYISQRMQLDRKTKDEIATFEKQYERLEEEFYRAVPEERRIRNLEVPPVAEVFDHAMRLGPLLWTRRPEHWTFLSVRLGTCTTQSRNTIRRQDPPEGLPEYVERVEQLEERYALIDDVPVLESFQSAGSIGIAGPKSLAGDALRGLGVQLFGLHAPNEVVAVSIADPEWVPELDWLTWLPHTSSETNPFKNMPLADSAPTGQALLSAIEGHIMSRVKRANADMRTPYKDDWEPMDFGTDVERAAKEASFPGGTAIVLIVTNDAPVDRPRLTQILERGPDVGVYTVFVAPTVETLPAACRAYVDVTRGLEDADVGTVRSGETYKDVRVEGVSNEYMHMLAKRLAPVVDSSTVIEDSSDIPSSVGLLTLIGNEVATDPQFVVDRWRENLTIIDRSGAQLPRLKKPGTLRATIGQGAADPMALDLRTQGPHALVGGTTGAGKSEFLQAWVLAMAAAHSPDRVTFLFVDYKGGSAFADCVELPHCVGLVTDLSPHLVRRALTSLRAELHHREHLFNRKKAKDLLELEKRRDPDCPPALVLVIDEFAALAGEVPEFVDGVVDIAQRGRSLGIHLIMATQRPAGVIKDNLRANTNLRVALRMADESDSKDVVDDPVAGTFDPSIPGRGIAKTGPGRLVPFQSAYAGGWTDPNEVKVAEVKVAELRFGSVSQWERESSVEVDDEIDPGPNDQHRIVETIVEASKVAGIPAPRRPWLDDLETTVDLRDMPVRDDSRILLGVADVPERQLQAPMYFDADKDGSLIVYGTSGSGKSTLLRTIAIAACMRPESNVEVYGLDFASGALRSLEELPQVGSIIDGDDTERVQRLLRSLGRILDDRSKRFSAANASDLTEYREATGRSEPRVLVLIDNYPQLKADWDSTTARQPYYGAFMRILGEGRPLGVHAIFTADRATAVPSSVSSNVSRRVVLRLSDVNSYVMASVAKDVLSEHSPPGRAIVDGYETQIASLGGTTNVAQQSRLLKELAAALREQGARDVEEIGALPTKLDEATMPDRIDDFPVLGVAEETLAPREFDAIGTFVVTGPPGSGKTTAMKSLINSMVRFDPEVQLYHFAGRRSQLQDYAPWVRSAMTPDAAKDLAVDLTAMLTDDAHRGRIMIVVENVPQFADTDAERKMKEMFQAVNRSEHFLIGDVDVAQATGSFGFMGDFKAGRKGIALKPDSFDGDAVFKVAFPRIKRHESPEGRGIFVQSGRWAIVQMPLVTAKHAPVLARASAAGPAVSHETIVDVGGPMSESA